MANISKSQINAIIAIMILLGLGFWIPSRFSFTRTKSLDHRLFYIAHGSLASSEIKNGSFIMFQNNHPLISDLIHETKTNKIIKKVVCAKGSMLKVMDREFYCDGRKLGRAVGRTPGGRKIQHFTYNGIVPTGSYFVMGTSADSFDSRYFGFVDRDSIIGIAYPII